MNRYTLPPGIVKVCAGLVQGPKRNRIFQPCVLRNR